MHKTDAPQYMNDAREEILMALAENDRESADFHTRRANILLRRAVDAVQREPEYLWNWSILQASERHHSRESNDA